MKNPYIRYFTLFLLAGSLLIPNNSVAIVDEQFDVGPIPSEFSYDTKGKFTGYHEQRNEDKPNIPTSLTIKYQMDEPNYTNKMFYLWVDGMEDGVEIAPDGVDDFGMFVTINPSDYLEHDTFYFIIKNAGTWAGQSQDIPIVYSEMNFLEDGSLTVWCIDGSKGAILVYDNEEATKGDKIKEAYLGTDWKTITVKATGPVSSYTLYTFNNRYYQYGPVNRERHLEDFVYMSGTVDNESIFTIKLPHYLPSNVILNLKCNFANYPDKPKTKNISYEYLYNTPRFNKFYTTDEELGALYTSSKTTFRVWTPVCSRVELRIYDVGTPASYGIEGASNSYSSYEMSYIKGGVWSCEVEKDLNGKYYTYHIFSSEGEFEVCDPYAHAAGLNGIRGMILDFNSTNPNNWSEVDNKISDIKGPNDLSVYEVHVQDLTSDSTWTGNNKPGTYKAFVESGTTYSENGVSVKTGFDHIVDLGVKAVQLMPVYDQANSETGEKASYNWGYNPLNYNVIEGAYSSDPTKGEVRVKEFKEMISSLAQKDIRVIMDVVYNHVNSAPSSNFNKLMPYYYFKMNADGTFANGSGCGNETNSEAKMMSKFIVDSLVWWAKEFKIKGFRFDLMALLDTDTLANAATELYKIDPDIVMYGEGWRGDFGGTYLGKKNPADTYNVYHHNYSTSSRVAVGAFNDTGRDALKGKNDPTYGFMQDGPDYASSENRDKVAEMIWGIHRDKGANPHQTVNYASCHDNYTLFDQLFYTLGTFDSEGKEVSAPSLKQVMNTSLATESLVMASNGIAFMQGGEEIFRSKELSEEEIKKVEASTYRKQFGHYISHNSYNAPANVNAFKWNRKISITRDGETVSTTDYFNKFKKAVALHHSMSKFEFRMDGFPYSKTSAGNEIKNISWAGSQKGSGTSGTYNGAAGFQLDEYFIFLAGRNWAWIPFGDVNKSTLLYNAGEYTYDSNNGTVNLGNFDKNTGGAIVVFKRNA